MVTCMLPGVQSVAVAQEPTETTEVQHADRLGAMNAPDCLVAQDTDPSQFHTTLPSPHFGVWES